MSGRHSVDNSVEKRCKVFLRFRLEVPTNMNVHGVPPDIILQLIPLFSKKYEGLNSSKFKCRMVVLGNHWKDVYGISDTYSNDLRSITGATIHHKSAVINGSSPMVMSMALPESHIQ